MFINITVLSKNKNSLKKFLILFKDFCLKNQIKKNLYIIKKKITNKKKVSYSILPPIQEHTEDITHNNLYKKNCTYRYKIKKNKYFRKKCLNGVLNYYQQKQKRKVFTTLKSPHVNKTAQEQMEYRTFSKKIKIFSFQILKFLFLIKKIQAKICPDVEIKIKFLLNIKSANKTKILSLNPDNYKLKFLVKKKDIADKKQIINYLKLFDIYGELNFTKLFR